MNQKIWSGDWSGKHIWETIARDIKYKRRQRQKKVNERKILQWLTYEREIHEGKSYEIRQNSKRFGLTVEISIVVRDRIFLQDFGWGSAWKHKAQIRKYKQKWVQELSRSNYIVFKFVS